MTGEIFDCFCKEIQSLFTDGTSVIRDTQFNVEQMPMYTVPCVVISMNDSPDEYQYIGGATAADWDFSIRSYFYDLNGGLDNDSGYNQQAYSQLDTIRRHIASEQWVNNDMITMVETYGFKLALNGTIRQTQLQQDGGGLLPGYELNYNSVAIDTDTTNITDILFLTETNNITVEDDKGNILEQTQQEVIVLTNPLVMIGGVIHLHCKPDEMLSYSWIGANGFTSNLQNPSITNAQIIDSGTYICTVIDMWGRIGVGSVNVVVS